MNQFIIILTAVISVVSTYFVNVNLKQGGVRASALLSLLIALFFYYQPDLLNQYLTTNIPIVFFGASFIGMANPRVITHYWILIAAALIFSLLFFHSPVLFNGYGGLLGTTAFSSLLVVFGLNKISSLLKNNNS